MSNDKMRAAINTAPAVLSLSDKAMWVTGWNECLDAIAAQAQEAKEAPSEPVADCKGGITVPTDAVEWLKTRYPALCEKAGLCERIGRSLYTRTFLASPAPAIAQAVVPDGWKLVPVELSIEMRKAWDTAPDNEDDDVSMRNAYRAMIAAAPTPDSEKKVAQ